MNKYVFSVFNRSGDVVWEETRSSYEKCIEFLVLNDVLDEDEELIDEDYGMVIIYKVPNWFILNISELKDTYEVGRISR